MTNIATEGTLRAAWLEQRKDGVGGSEVAALLGVSPWSTPLSVYLSKIGDDVEDHDSEIMEAGRRLQRPIADWYAEKRGIAIEDLGQYEIQRHPACPRALATLDYWQANHPDFGACPLEIKNVSEFAKGGWEDEEVPIHVQVQALHQAWVMGAKGVTVAWLQGGHRLRFADFPSREDFQDGLRAAIETFWSAHVEPRIAPAPSEDKPGIDSDTLKALFGKGTGSAIVLPASFQEIAEAWEQARVRKKNGEEDEKRFANLVKAALGLNSWGVLPDGTAFQWCVEPKAAYAVAASEPRVFRRVKRPKVQPKS